MGAAVVFADADLDRAVAAAAAAVATNAGQVCSATARLLVESSVHDEAVARIVDAVERLEPGADFGPIITEEQFRKVVGPVLVTMPFTGEDEALARANDTDYGLVAAVWSGDVARVCASPSGSTRGRCR
ncbi:hypothetical protein GCM10010182_70210 [Actinomadura cremea]|nr:hypothetical protein GCM10010182_70210 [Actinomadura cremea]